MKFLKGMDISSLKEVESLGGKFYDKGVEKDALTILQSYGVNAVRLRLWNDPYTEDGKPYGAGTNDLPTTIELTKRALNMGMETLLDFHYSDFWADPGKQRVPKAWRGMNLEQLEEAVYQYTKDTLMEMKRQNASPTLVQVGNEVTNGILWPYGKVPDYDNLARLLNAGIKGVRAADKDIPVMIHLDNGGNNALYREWFDHFIEKGEDFQIIGLSYYPFWHGTLDDLSNNMNDIALRYGKELMLAEVSMGYTMEDYASYEKLAPHERKGMATKPELVQKIEYPMSKEGQKAFLEDLFARMKKVPDGKMSGFFYWEAAWIPVAGSGWASDEAIAYMEEKGPGGNEWANQALFDYDGNALPALEAVRDFTF
ncbi:MAG: glycosyl hydrolase 53 family protein [Bacillus sp. (in: Bacteria)]|nr:glycosyl hydrolase 53 family protein [Bacillus sp. (in: firmicutes)]MCM1425704.1 glycosyl hydrolase 53 family protein [Eubacterium sp.]